MKIHYRSNLIAGIVSVILGIICFLLVPQQIGEDYAVTYGITSRTVPYAVAVLWIVCGAGLIAQSLLLHKDEMKTLEVKKEAKAMGYIAVLILYAFLFEKSFIVSTLFLGMATLAFTGSKKKLFYGLIALIVIVLYLLFSKVLHVQLP